MHGNWVQEKKEKMNMDAASQEFLRLYSLLLEARDIEEEKRILRIKDELKAYYYARDTIGGRWPEAEKFIKKDPQCAFFYAMYIIRDRWPEAEKYIMKDSHYAYAYARYVIKGRWPEAEEVIKKDLFEACYYAMHVIKGRWPETEEAIKEVPWIACNYALYVIKGRWPEAEEVIKKDPLYWNHHYLESICKDCQGEGIISLGIGGAEEECIQCNGSGFDENKIAKNFPD